IDGELRQLDEDIRLDKRRNHTIEVVVDRLLIKSGIQKRLADSVAVAAKLTEGIVLVSIIDGSEKLYSEKMTCIDCGISVPTFEPRSFSFNSSYGACRVCQGIGMLLEVEPQRLIPDLSKSLEEIDFVQADIPTNAQLKEALLAIARQAGISD